MKWTITAALGAAIALSPAHAGSITDAALEKAKTAITWTLKDPESVRWRRVKVASNGNVCIEVNAKNSYGGYAGFELYFYNGRTGEVVGDENYGWMWCQHFVTMPKNSILVNTLDRNKRKPAAATRPLGPQVR